MKLHRAARKPDWLKRPAKDYSGWQQLAKRSHGYITPANIISVVGFGLVLYGLWLILQQHILPGIVAVGVGRLCDIADGYVAEKTGTKSPIGESLDAGLDKLATLLGLLALGIAHIAPWWVLGLLALPHLVITAMSAVAIKRHKRLHPSRSGKLSMAFGWLGLGSLLLAALGKSGGTFVVTFQVTAYTLLAASIALGVAAIVRYYKESQTR